MIFTNEWLHDTVTHHRKPRARTSLWTLGNWMTYCTVVCSDNSRDCRTQARAVNFLNNSTIEPHCLSPIFVNTIGATRSYWDESFRQKLVVATLFLETVLLWLTLWSSRCCCWSCCAQSTLSCGPAVAQCRTRAEAHVRWKIKREEIKSTRRLHRCLRRVSGNVNGKLNKKHKYILIKIDGCV